RRSSDLSAVGGQQQMVQRGGATLGMQCLELFEGHRLTQIEGPGLTATQGGDMGATTQCRADILDQGTDIGALAALHFQTQAIPFQSQQGQSAYGNRS